jgi:cytochrome P450
MNLQPPLRSPQFSSHDYQAALYQHYSDYLRDTPVFCSLEGCVYVTRHADCLQLLNSPPCRRTAPGSDKSPFTTNDTPSSALEKMISHWMVFMDPPRHDVVRKAFATAFTTKAVAAMEPLIRAQVRELLACWPSTGHVEVVQQLAFPLPVRVIAAMMGVPMQDAELFQNWALQLTEALDTANAESLRRGAGVTQELKAYFEHLIATRKTLPEACLINRVAEVVGSALTPEEYLYGCAFMLWAGHETTKNLIANGLLLLAQHPSQFTRLQQEPALLERAIDEILRYESPVQKVSRWTHEDVTFGDYAIPAGTLVTALLGAAHRDPAVFDQPDSFDIARAKGRHLAFGTGIHHCLGALLARTEARIVLGELVPRLKSLALVDYRWRTFSAFRSLDWLKIDVTTC